MATLTEAQRDELTAEVMRMFSGEWVEISPTESQLRAGVALFDDAMETTETNILNSVSTSVRDWLVANPAVSRWILENVAIERRRRL